MAAVGDHVGVGNGKRLRPVPEFLDVHLVHHVPGLRGHRPAALEGGAQPLDRLIARVRRVGDPAQALDEHPQGMGAALVHQGARHDHVVHEVAGQKPVVGPDVGLGPDPAEPVSAPGRVELEDAVDQLHAAAGKPQGLGQVDAVEGLPKAACQVPGAQRVQGLIVIAPRRQGHRVRPVQRLLAGPRPLVLVGQNDPARVVHFLPGEEAGAPMGHGDEGGAPDRSLEVEEEEIGLPLAQKLFDLDVVADGLAGTRQFAVELHRGVEQPIGAAAAHDPVDAEIGAQEQVGLAGLHRDTDRRPAAVEVPGVRKDVVLGHHPAGAECSRRAPDLQDAVHQHQRLVRQPHPGCKGIRLGELRPQHGGGRPAGEFEALRASEGRGGGRGRIARGRGVALCCQVEQPGLERERLGVASGHGA